MSLKNCYCNFGYGAIIKKNVDLYPNLDTDLFHINIKTICKYKPYIEQLKMNLKFLELNENYFFGNIIKTEEVVHLNLCKSENYLELISNIETTKIIDFFIEQKEKFETILSEFCKKCKQKKIPYNYGFYNIIQIQ